jgi:OmpA-OmpF porin, OOP family
MRYRQLAIVAGILGAPVVATAQPVSGLYVGLGAGWNYLQSIQLKNISGQADRLGGFPIVNKSANFGSGAGVVGSVGWGFGNGFRAEVEGNYRWNPVNNNGGGFGVNSIQSITGGSEQKAGVMVNGYYDFTDAFGPGLSPYVGVGIGYQHIGWSNILVQGTIPSGPTAGGSYLFRFNNGQYAFAYQAMLGIAYSLASVMPGLSLTGEYRFLGTAGSPTFKAQFFSPHIARGANIQLGNDYNQGIFVGIRYAFNVAPPPPPPAPAPVVAPAPAPARSYLVFFDWDRADLTDRARQVIAEAAQNSTHVQYTRIEVNGYTDTSGTAAYNLRLSVRRAQAVEGELVRDGVPQNVIDIHGFGETHLLVPTGPGVREPQNRRVEIILQ